MPFADAPPELLATDPECVGAAPGRTLARLRGSRRRLLHARPDQGVDRHARRGGQRRPRQARHSRDARHRVSAPPRRRSREDDATSRFSFSSRSASPRASGARCSTRCSISSATTTRTTPLAEVLPEISRRLSRRYGALGTARSRRPDVRAAQGDAADALARARRSRRCRRRVMTPRGGVPAPRARPHRTRAAREARRSRARDERRAVSAGHSDAHARRDDRRRPTVRT